MCAMNPITELRERLGLTQTELAEKIGRNQGSVSRWESGTQTPDIEALAGLQGLGMDVASFVSWATVQTRQAA